MTELLQRRIIQPILALLTQGVTPEKIAMSVVFGLALGIFPVMGSTTALCALAAIAFGLNLPAIQIVNYFVYPLQLLLIVPFMKMGGRLFGGAKVSLSLSQMVEMFRSDPTGALHVLGRLGAQAVAAWSIIAPPVGVVGYLILVWILRRVAGTRNEISAVGS